MNSLSKDMLVGLPRWAIVAFIARCGQRLLPRYVDEKAEPAEQRLAASQAIRFAEERAKIGGEFQFDEALEVDGQFIDNYDLDSLRLALSGSRNAAENTYADLHADADMEAYTGAILAVTTLACLAFDTAFGNDVGSPPSHLPQLAEAAAGWATSGNAVIENDVLRDFESLRDRAASEKWTDECPVSPSVFGELWPEGRPPGWPPQQLSFRPRARIIRTIGDRLISGPEAAVVELIKNSHDADASYVRIKYLPPIESEPGSILVEDDGHGMTLEDIQQKWMEPATSDKKERKFSPAGRRMLGSKGIGRFAASRLGRRLELVSSAFRTTPQAGETEAAAAPSAKIQTTRIPQLDWNMFDETNYLEDIRFPVESLIPATHTGTLLKITLLRDEWSEKRLIKLHGELRRLISPIQQTDHTPCRIFLDLSQCTVESCGFDGLALMPPAGPDAPHEAQPTYESNEVRPYPVLTSCDYTVEGSFDETGTFEGTMAVGRAGLEPECIRISIPLKENEGQEGCGIVLVRLHIFDREADAVRRTAKKAGFGEIGVREARKILDSTCGVAIYRESFRIRPYGDAEYDWLTLDAKRVQNPTMKIGRNQIAGIVTIDDEESSHLVERSSREGLEENGSFVRLQSLISQLLSEVVEPRRRQFRISAGIDARQELSLHDVYRRVKMDWSKVLVAKLPQADRAEAETLIAKESERLTAYLKRLEEWQAKLEAQVTLGKIVGEVMHQGNTPLSFLETETARIANWWPHLFKESPAAEDNRSEVPRILNGMTSSNQKLRVLFNSLSPLSGAARGKPAVYDPVGVIDETEYLLKDRREKAGITFHLSSEPSCPRVFGYKEDLATAIANILDNEIYWLVHHNIPEPSIEVAISTESNRCIIKVADNGVGVPPQFAEQVFDVGFTLKPQGNGLGMSIAREAISRSNGELELLASPAGAVFQISLPCEETKDSPNSVEL